MRTFLERVLRATIPAATAALCILSPAQAAFYPGAWDPIYGIPFVGSGSVVGYELGWRGEVTVFVPDSCALGSGPRNYGLFSTCSQNSAVQSAVVEFYDNANPLVTTGSVAFNTSSMSILSLHFVDDQLISLATLPSNWDQAVWTSTPPVSPFFSLLFADPTFSNILRVLGFGDEIPANYFGPLLLSHPSADLDNLNIDSLDDLLSLIRTLGDISVSDVASNPPEYPNGALFRAAAQEISVPEPGSLVLVSLALLAIGWVAGSRRRV